MMATKALTTIGPRGLERARGWTEEEVGMIRSICSTGDQKLDDGELKTFLYVSWERGLNPIKKEIYAIRRDGKVTHQTGIDGFRVIGARTGLHAGTDDAVFTGKPGVDGFAATVTVYKIVSGVRCPFTATARWEEYCPGGRQAFMWNRMPHSQLAKCAESLALRKAFPEALGGLYTLDEMAQAEKAGAIEAEVITAEPAPHPEHCGCDKCMPPPDEAAPKPVPSWEAITQGQRALLFGEAKRLGVTHAEIRWFVNDMTGTESTASFPMKRFDELRGRIKDLSESRKVGAYTAEGIK